MGGCALEDDGSDDLAAADDDDGEDEDAAGDDDGDEARDDDGEYCPKLDDDGECVDLCEDVTGSYRGLLRIVISEPGLDPVEDQRPIDATIDVVGDEPQEQWPCPPIEFEPTGEIFTIEGTLGGEEMTGAIAQTERGLGYCLIEGEGHGIRFYQGHFQSRCTAMSGSYTAYLVNGDHGLVREL